MIVVTRLNGARFAVNPDLIERIQASPDTTLVLVGGTTYIVTETLDEVIDLIAAYRARVISQAYDGPRRRGSGSSAESGEIVAFPTRPEAIDGDGGR